MAKFFDTWPKYVKTIENHSSDIYLVNNRKEYINLMLNVATRWYENDEFGEESWYINESYEEWFKSQMGGMTVAVYDEHIKPLDSSNNFIRNLKEYANSLKSRYDKESAYLKDLQFLKKISEGERPAGFANRLHGILKEVPYDDKLRFLVDDFDTIPREI